MNWVPSHTDTEDDSAEISVNIPSLANLMERIRADFRAGRGFSLATLNLDHIVKLRRDPLFRQAYGAHTYVTADGNPIVWFSRLAGQSVDLVPGSELVAPLSELARDMDLPVALFGSTPDSLRDAALALQRKVPGISIVAQISPPFGFDPFDPASLDNIEQIKASGARLCFLALGAPKQELFAARAQSVLPHVGFVSIGAGLDFLSGNQKRAPRVVRMFALEWVWRMVHSPRRLVHRYLKCILVLPSLTIAAWRARRAGPEIDQL
jgi:N-acetylglucosaminyldiphosphoundecaprenol N-acetyl-beta-D-mannosaminyltransferase